MSVQNEVRGWIWTVGDEGKPSRRFLPVRASALIVVVALAQVPGAALAASGTWFGTTNTTWNTATNWAASGSGPIPGSASPSITNGDTVTFNNAGNSNVAFGPPSAGFNVKNVTFTSNAVAAYTLGSNTNYFTLTDGGTIQITSSAANNVVERFSLVKLAGTTYTFQNDKNNTGTILRFQGSPIAVTGLNTAATTLTLTGSGTGANLIIGVIENGLSSSMGITKSGSTIWRFDGANTYTGPTAIDLGTLRAGGSSSTAFGNNSAITLANAVAFLDLNDLNQTIGSLAGGGASGGNVLLGSGTLTTGGNNANTSYGGVISGTGGLTKIGNGKQILSGANSYSGTTTVSAGILQIDSSSTGQGNYSVAGTLGGGGTIGLAADKKITIANNGRLAPGASAGILGVAGSQTGAPTAGNATVNFVEGANFDVEIAGTTLGSYDRLNIIGNIDLGNAMLNVTPTISLAADQFFTIIQNDDDDAVLGTFFDLPEGANVLTANGYNLRITYTGEGNALSENGNDVLLYTVVVPEPALLGAAGLALAGMGRRRRV